jgi:3-phosphoglycerate kinase
VADFNKKTIKDIKLDGKKILLRADYNVPVKDGKISDDYRIKQSLPTIKYILDQPGTSLVIISHLGRPKTAFDKQFSLIPVAKHLSKMLNKPIRFSHDCIGEEASNASDSLLPGQIAMLENLRFHTEEEENDKHFAQELASRSGAKVFVQDGFGVVHRAHASTDAITKYLPAVAGLLLEKEVSTISKVMKEPERPLVAVVGGAKVSDKIGILNKLIDHADSVAIGGAMANAFFKAKGVKVGRSLVEHGITEMADDIMEKAHRTEQKRQFSFLLPVDAVVSTNLEGKAPTRIVDIASHSISDIEAYPKAPKPASYTIAKDEMVLDIGPISAGYFAGAIKMARTVIWNGPLGITEVRGLAGAHDPFAHGTHMLVESMIGKTNHHGNKPFSLVGGGDTAAYVEKEGLIGDFSFVSTGGGATLDLMSGKKLPGVESLQDK